MTDPFARPAQPSAAPDDVRTDTATGLHPIFSVPPRRNTGLVIAGTIGIVVASIAVILAVAFLLRLLGAAAIGGALFALVPLAIVLLGIRWLDRWEPEPLPARVFAFLWGGGVAVVIALAIGYRVDVLLTASGIGADSDSGQAVGALVEAPIVEEAAKGLGVLMVFLFARRLFDGPVDGIVYAATVAAGFAFIENIEYIGIDVAKTGFSSETLFTFFLRGILSPFAHVMFTSMTGLAIGIASTRFGRLGGVVAYLIGLVPAILLHSLWNSLGYLGSGLSGYLLLYAFVQVPLFGGLIGLVIYLRRKEAAVTVVRLAEYAQAGWFNPAEVRALGTPAGRRQARGWAASTGRSPQMSLYIRDATRLAMTRQRIVVGRGRAQAQADELRLLGAVTADRRALLAVG